MAGFESLRALASRNTAFIQEWQGWQSVPTSNLSEKIATFSTRTASKTLIRRLAVYILSAALAIYLLCQFVFSGHTASADGWLSSSLLSTDKASLLTNINYNSTIVSSVKTGEMFQLTPEEASQAWRQPLLFNDPFSMRQVPLDNSRCPVYTYFDSNAGTLRNSTVKDKKGQTQRLQDFETEIELVKTWSRAWWALGFMPIVLNYTDVEQHPRYKEFKTSNVLSSDTKAAHAKWLAWLSVGAGIFSDYRVIPITRDGNHEAIRFLKSCNYEERMAFDDYSLSLIVSDIKDTKPFLFDIMRGYTEEQLVNNFEVYNQDAFAYYSNRNYRAVTNTLKGGYSANKLESNDARIAPTDILSMINTHLRQVFLDAYPGGLGFVSPTFDPSARIFADTLNNCPNSPFVNRCPPSPVTLHNLAYNKNGKQRKALRFACKPLPCSQRGRSLNSYVEGRSGLPSPELRMFTVATLWHPWAHLAVQHETVTVDIVRQEVLRDTLVRDLTNPILGSDVIGTDIRLLLLKDSMYQASYQSNISWILAGVSTEQIVEMVERDVGFDLQFDRRKRISSSSRSRLALSLETQLNLSEEFLNATSKRILNDLIGNDYLQEPVFNYTMDPEFDALKAWNPADYEIWRFLNKWMATKFQTHQFLETQMDLIEDQAGF